MAHTPTHSNFTSKLQCVDTLRKINEISGNLESNSKIIDLCNDFQLFYNQSSKSTT